MRGAEGEGLKDYILFVCGHNAGRSQIAQAYFNYLRENFPNVGTRYEAISVGTNPGENVNPQVAEAMGEVGIDLSNPKIYFPKGKDSDYMITRLPRIRRTIVACDDNCEILPPEMMVEPVWWELPDPHGQTIEVVREVRDLVRNRVMELLTELNTQLPN